MGGILNYFPNSTNFWFEWIIYFKYVRFECLLEENYPTWSKLDLSGRTDLVRYPLESNSLNDWCTWSVKFYLFLNYSPYGLVKWNGLDVIDSDLLFYIFLIYCKRIVKISVNILVDLANNDVVNCDINSNSNGLNTFFSRKKFFLYSPPPPPQFIPGLYRGFPV